MNIAYLSYLAYLPGPVTEVKICVLTGWTAYFNLHKLAHIIAFSNHG
jgi:hypothetical protein